MIKDILHINNHIRNNLRNWYYQQSIPKHIKDNYIKLNSKDNVILKASLNEIYQDQNDNNGLFTCLNQRLKDHRTISIPWLDSVRPLKNSRILEIGCGHGASTISLAEQGAKVTAIDIDNNSIQLAKKKCEIYGINVDFHLINASNAALYFTKEKFDIIIFWAVLEHMTIEERMEAMKGTFNMLNEDGLWCVIGTPNRLHYFDTHTSQLPFFQWLPDNLALKYAHFSKRQDFSSCFSEISYNSEQLINFYRWGRSVSYHEIELSLKPLKDLNIVSTLKTYCINRSLLSTLILRPFCYSGYESFMHKLYPTINRCFFEPSLNFIIKK